MASPIRRHYLKKLLIEQEIADELSKVSKAPEALGLPIRSRASNRHPQDANQSVEAAQHDDRLPVLRFIFQQYVVTFPFLAKTDQEAFWSGKVVPFVSSFNGKRMSSSNDRAELTKRAKFGRRIQSMLVMLIGAGISSGIEQAATAADSSDASLESTTSVPNQQDVLVDIVAVRRVLSDGRVRRWHCEFVVSYNGTLTAHRYGSFRELHEALRTQLKDRLTLPQLPRKEKSKQRSYFQYFASYESDNMSDGGNAATPAYRSETKGRKSSLDREAQRLTLRAYLRALLRSPELAKHSLVLRFLSTPRTALSEHDELDRVERRKLDLARESQRCRFDDLIRERTSALQQTMNSFKSDLIKEGGITRLFAAIRDCQTIADLPENYRVVLSWGRIELAATLHRMFLSSDNSSDLFAQAKRIHTLMPYTLIKNLLRFSNPVLMMRSMIDLFLATPFGRPSLFQRMFSSNLHAQIKELDARIRRARMSINDDLICDAVERSILADETQRLDEYEEQVAAAAEYMDILTPIVRVLPATQQSYMKTARAHWVAALDCSPHDVASARVYGSALDLLRCSTLRRDQQQLMELTFETSTAALLKDIVSIFYEPLVRMYKASSVHDSISDFARFADDCMQTVKEAEMSTTTPIEQLQAFMNLVERHEESFFRFVHNAHNHDEGLFTDLMGWIDSIVHFLRSGKSRLLDLDDLIAITALDEDKLWKEVDDYIHYTVSVKQWRKKKLRAQLAATNHFDMPVGLSGKDFGLDDDDLDDVYYEQASDDEQEHFEELMDKHDPLVAEMRRRMRMKERANEPRRPVFSYVNHLSLPFKRLLSRLLLSD
ncbi:hypothetical protein PYCC9005_001921 [Savitreella phatthalungensis]